MAGLRRGGLDCDGIEFRFRAGKSLALGGLADCERQGNNKSGQFHWAIVSRSEKIPKADAIAGGRMVNQSWLGLDFRQVETQVDREPRKLGGQCRDIAPERSIVVFVEISVLVEPETTARPMPVEGALRRNMSDGIIEVHEPEYLLARVREEPVQELLIAHSRAPVRVERNIVVSEPAGGEHRESSTETVTRKTDLGLRVSVAEVNHAVPHVCPYAIERSFDSLMDQCGMPKSKPPGSAIGAMVEFEDRQQIGIVKYVTFNIIWHRVVNIIWHTL